jgi:hypothetical protein
MTVAVGDMGIAYLMPRRVPAITTRLILVVGDKRLAMTPGVYTFPGGHWYQRTSTSTPLAILALFSSYGRRGTFT